MAFFTVTPKLNNIPDSTAGLWIQISIMRIIVLSKVFFECQNRFYDLSVSGILLVTLYSARILCAIFVSEVVVYCNKPHGLDGTGRDMVTEHSEDARFVSYLLLIPANCFH